MLTVVRADASEQIGSGHVRRTMALAAVLRNRGIDVRYVSRRAAGDLHETIEAAGFNVDAITDEHESDAALASMPAVDLIIVDNYGLDEAWERRMRQRTKFLFAIDDLGRTHDCDLLLDQNLGVTAQRYAHKVPAGARLLLGPRYALLRDEFRRYIDEAPVRDGNLRRILVSMGGFDDANETGKAIEALRGIQGAGFRVDVVLSAEAPHARSVAQQCADAGYAYHGDVQTISKLMEQADLALGAMGATAWERCLLGLPAVVVTLADNQREGAAACAKANAAVWLGDASDVRVGDIREAVERLAADPERLRMHSRSARAAAGVEDGVFSTDKVAGAIMEVIHG